MSKKTFNFEGKYLIIHEPINTCVHQFTVYEIVGEEEDGTLCFELKGGTGPTDHVPTTDEAEVYLEGSIKWDGCSNWDFNTDECAKHFCGYENAIDLGRLMRKMYSIARDEMKLTASSLCFDAFPDEKEDAENKLLATGLDKISGAAMSLSNWYYDSDLGRHSPVPAKVGDQQIASPEDITKAWANLSTAFKEIDALITEGPRYELLHRARRIAESS